MTSTYRGPDALSEHDGGVAVLVNLFVLSASIDVPKFEMNCQAGRYRHLGLLIERLAVLRISSGSRVASPLPPSSLLHPFCRRQGSSTTTRQRHSSTPSD